MQNPKNIPNVIPKPCPSCGWHQSATIRYHKGTIFPSLFPFLVSLGLIVVLVASIFSFYPIRKTAPGPSPMSRPLPCSGSPC